MMELTLLARAILYLLLGLMAIYTLIVWGWQFNVPRGEAMKNADGSFDSWQERTSHYGMAIADIFVACPLNIAGIILIFVSPR